MFFQRLAAAALSAIALAVAAPAASAQTGFKWQLVKHEGRDYIPLENVAQFYRFQGGLRAVDHRYSFAGSGASMEMTGGDSREVVINGVRQWLSFPIIHQGDQLLVSRFDLAKTLDPALRPAVIPEVKPFRTIVLDAGHGGTDRGAKSVTGFEKDYTLDVVRDLKKQLETAGFRVRLTRDDDAFISLEQRAEQANQENDAIFVSVHFNHSVGAGAVNANGIEVYAMTPRGAPSTQDTVPMLDVLKDLPANAVDNASLALATAVHHSLLGHIPHTDRGVKRARFVVLKMCKLPSVLIEGGFLSNPNESQQINDAKWRHQLAESIVTGLQAYQQLAEKKQSPRLLADYRMERLPTAGRIVDPDAVARATTPAVLPTSNVFADSSAHLMPEAATLSPATPAAAAAPSATPTPAPAPKADPGMSL